MAAAEQRSVHDTVVLNHGLISITTELENTAPRIKSDYEPKHADIISGLKAKQKRKERKIKRMIFSIGGWVVIAFMIYLIIVTARTVTKIWDPYDVLGVSRVSPRGSSKGTLETDNIPVRYREANQVILP
jgi:preprotein translocase subunit Sec63